MLLTILLLLLCNTEGCSELMERKRAYPGHCKAVWLWGGGHLRCNHGALQRVSPGSLWLPFPRGIYSGSLTLLAFEVLKFFHYVFNSIASLIFSLKNYVWRGWDDLFITQPKHVVIMTQGSAKWGVSLKHSIYIDTWELGSQVNARRKWPPGEHLPVWQTLSLSWGMVSKNVADSFSGGSLTIQSI